MLVVEGRVFFEMEMIQPLEIKIYVKLKEKAFTTTLQQQLNLFREYNA